jgi:hypothetical protein
MPPASRSVRRERRTAASGRLAGNTADHHFKSSNRNPVDSKGSLPVKQSEQISAVSFTSMIGIPWRVEWLLCWSLRMSC